MALNNFSVDIAYIFLNLAINTTDVYLKTQIIQLID